MNETAGFRISILQRMVTTFIVLTALVVTATVAGLWSTASATRSIGAIRQGTSQLGEIRNLQVSWQLMMGAVDNLLAARSTVTYQQYLTDSAAAFKDQLTFLTELSLGTSPELIAENHAIVQDLLGIKTELDDVLADVNRFSESNRWDIVLGLRQSRLADLQRRLDNGLRQVTTNVQKDIDSSIATANSIQNRTLTTFIITTALAIVITAWVIYMARRTMILPLRQLTSSAQRITAGDLSPLKPLPQRDEIGDLSHALVIMTNWLHESQQTLESRVAERTAELEQRTTQLEVAAQVARDIASAQHLEDLLTRSVNIIRDRFGFYHAGIFLTDERHQYAVLRAATGQAGQEMLAGGHKLAIGETGLVSYVTDMGKARVSLDVELDATHYKNPLLPDTRSEAALPLKVGDQVIGALDVQSQEPGAFNEVSITTLQVMADQLAIAIQNARLLQEAQENLRELEIAYGSYGRHAWERFALRLASSANPVIGYEYDGIGLTPLFSEASLGTEQAISKMSRLQADRSSEEKKPVSIPLQVRGETIGGIDIWPEDRELTPEEIYLLVTIANRLSQTLESIRLFEETQARASREQAINVISSQMRSSVNIDTILQNTVRELGNTLGVARAFIQVGVPETAPDNSGVERS